MDTKQRLVEQYIPLANKLAYQKKRTLPRHIDIEELQSAAYLGLVEAASRYDETKGASFPTFAYMRIFGAINDYLRSLGNPSILSLDSTFGDQDCSLKDEVRSKDESDFEECLEVVANDLGEQAQDVLRLYLVDELSMKEVGQKIGVSESRVSQLLTSYRTSVKKQWNETDLRELLAA
jgi:RNA polymerase sigma factor (sigma-70 family)